MVEYAALALPSANRVYAASAPELMAAELRVVGGGAIGEIAAELIGGRPYLVFGGPALDGRNDHALARLSALYALFERRGDLLRPIELDPGQALDDDIVTIQRYVGKTNGPTGAPSSGTRCVGGGRRSTAHCCTAMTRPASRSSPGSSTPTALSC